MNKLEKLMRSISQTGTDEMLKVINLDFCTTYGEALDKYYFQIITDNIVEVVRLLKYEQYTTKQMTNHIRKYYINESRLNPFYNLANLYTIVGITEYRLGTGDFLVAERTLKINKIKDGRTTNI